MRQSWLSPARRHPPAGAKGTRGLRRRGRSRPARPSPGSAATSSTAPSSNDLDHEVQIHALQIDDELFLASALPFDDADYVNHSCEPNCGIVGSVLLVTMRDVAAGEELCFDYAMTDTDDYDEFDVLVRHAVVPRHVVTGADWKEPELRDRYRGWHSTYIAALVIS